MDRDRVLAVHNTLLADKTYLTRQITILGAHKLNTGALVAEVAVIVEYTICQPGHLVDECRNGLS